MTCNRKTLLLFGVLAAFASSAFPQQPPPQSKQPPPAAEQQQSTLPDEGNIPEEDDTEHREIVHHFSPIQAKKEFDTGMFYWHKGSYRAAAPRFTEATLWNPGWVDAYMKLAETHIKLHHKDEAIKALAKIQELKPGSKEAKEAKKLEEKL